MRTTNEMLDLIVRTAQSDERIRAVLMSGSRADLHCPKDVYQDFDIIYFVNDVKPFWDNMMWIESCFGTPILCQKPESMRQVSPDSGGNYIYLMIFEDGNRIDLTISNKEYEDNGEPAIVLLDKDHVLPDIQIDPSYWNVKKPTEVLYQNCANEFYWCLNNVAKGLERNEMPYVMEMMNHYVRDMLVRMISWHIGSKFDFNISVGKNGKYFVRFLEQDLYERYLDTYCSAEKEEVWNTAYKMIELFRDVAKPLGERLGYSYIESEETGILLYMNMVKNGLLEA